MDFQTEEISFIPYQSENFEEQERQLSELTSQVSARLESAFSGQDVDPFRDNTLASAWYRMHEDDPDYDTRSSNEVGGRHLVRFTAQ